MADFRRRPPHELDHLSDQELVDYLDGARESGDGQAQREALGYLAWAFEPNIRARVAAKVPVEAIDDVVMEVFLSLAHAGFDGKLIGQFGSFVRTVTERRIADFTRTAKRRPDEAPLAEENADDDDVAGGQPSTADETGLIDHLDAVGRVLETRNPLHRKVIRLYGAGVPGFEDLSADQVCERIAADGSGERMSVDNVAQIWSRFKRDLQGELDA